MPRFFVFSLLITLFRSQTHIMNTFVKIQGHPNWFMLIRNESELPNGIEDQAQERLKTITGEAFIHGKNPQKDIKLFGFVAMNKPDYRGAMQRTGRSLLIRPIGSYMTLSKDCEIIKQIESNNFPTESAEIAICENDESAEHNWVEHLKNTFPNKSIKTINFFRTRTVEDIKQQFEEVKYVTFSTTFTNMEWFENLLKSVNENQEVIGYCHDENKWPEALEMAQKANVKIKVINKLSLV